jgi:hypothetical protein
VISSAIPPHEKDGTNRHEPQDSPDRKTEIHRVLDQEEASKFLILLDTLRCPSVVTA